MPRITHILLILTFASFCGCNKQPEAKFNPWPNEEIVKQSIPKKTHKDPDLNAVMNAAVAAAIRAGFIFDGSKSDGGEISVKSRWSDDTVIINVTFLKKQNGELAIEHNWKCNGQTVYEGGDKILMERFFSTWNAIMKERRADPYNPKYDKI